MTKFQQKFGSWLAAAALFVGVTTTAQAQGVLWGAGSTNTYADSVGRFVNTSTTTNSIFGWTSLNYTSLNTDGSLKATWEATNNTNSTYSTIDPDYQLVSPSSADGMALFNSDYYYSTYNVYPQRAALKVDQAFSLAGYENTPLVVKLNTTIYEFDSDSTHLVFSVNGGASWPIAINIKDIAGVNTNDFFTGTVSIPLYQHLQGVTDLSNCMLGFVFEGDSYHWIIDDVRIEVAPDYDLTISGATSGITYEDGMTTARVVNAYMQPLNQISGDEYMMGARVLNNGSQTITAALNPRINLLIEKYNNGSWTQVYTNTLPITTDIVGFGRAVEFEYLEDLANPWIPTEEGVYRATYNVAHDGPDDSSTGDESIHYFEISESNGIYSKCQISQDGYPYATNASSPSTGANAILTGYEYGSMFYFPNGSQSILDSVSITAFAPRSIDASFTSGSIDIRVYEFNDDNNDGINDDQSSSSEISLVGIGSVSIANTATGLKTGKSAIADIRTAGRLKLADDKIYLVTMAQENPTGLRNSAGAYKSFAYAFDEELDYGFQSATTNVSNSVLRTTETTNGVSSTTWYRDGFIGNSTPSLMLHLADTVVSVNETVAINNLSVYPNPATAQLNISVDLEQASDVQYIMTDMNGRVVRMLNKANVQNEVVTFDINDLATGVYTITVKSDKGISTDKFVKK